MSSAKKLEGKFFHRKMFKFGGGFNKSKLKSRMKMGVTRVGMKKNKLANEIVIQKRTIAKLLTDGKDESARIKVESLIRDEFMVEALEIVELFLDLCHGRIQLITENKKCPHDMKEAVCTLIYVAPRLSVPELLEIRKQFREKYGKKFVQKAGENKDLHVNPKIILKLSTAVPDPRLCVKYLRAIADEHDVEWEGGDHLENPFGIGSRQGGGGGGGGGGGLDDRGSKLQALNKEYDQLRPQMFEQPQPPVQVQQVGFQPNINFTRQVIVNPGPPPVQFINPGQPVQVMQPVLYQQNSTTNTTPDSVINLSPNISQPPQMPQMPPQMPQMPQMPPQMPQMPPQMPQMPQNPPQMPSTEIPTVPTPQPQTDDFGGGDDLGFDFDSLQARFENLKNDDE